MAKVKHENEVEASFCSDQWLLDSVKMEEEENKAKILSKNIVETNEIESETHDNNEVQQNKKLTSPIVSDKEENILFGFKDRNNSCWKNVTFSTEVENLCTFKCPKCEKTFQTKAMISYHLRMAKHAVARKIIVNDYLFKVVLHKCKICHQRMLCDSETVVGHVKRYHKINDIQQYKDMAHEDFPRTEGTGESLSIRYDTKSWENALETAPVSEDVANSCIYECNVCQKIFKTRKSLMYHFETTRHAPERSTTDKNYYKHFFKNNYLIKIIVHKCKICNQRILCEKDVILKHFKHNHKIKTHKTYLDLAKNTSYRDKIQEMTENGNSRKRPRDFYSFAPVSQEIGNLCIYTCNVCNVTYVTRNGLRFHFKDSGHGDPAKAKMFLTKIVMHQCCICFKKVLCDNEAVRRHLKTHKVKSLNDYVVTKGVKWALGKMPDHQLELDKFCKTNSTKYHCTRLVNKQCKYICTECNYTCHSWLYMKKHVKSKGHGPLSLVTKYLQKVIFHQCHMCDEIILCDTYFLLNHVSRHKLTMSAYRKKFDLPMPVYFEESNDSYQSKLSAIIKDIPVIKTRTTLAIRANLFPNDGQATKHVGNICLIQCPFCSKSCFSFDSLRKHFEVSHKQKKLKIEIKHVTEARYHKCHICGMIVLCDNFTIRVHAKSAHRISYSHYRQNYVLKNGGKVIPTLQEFQRNSEAFDTFDTGKTENERDHDDDNNDKGLLEPSMISSESEESNG